ncbi:MAG: aminotransferase class I/II-fold pyridoxal phosphate-dependent enzyme [Planctomycetes bacterium]|nr:aminotransferase class I/II-fold pyridoxal phosphate-dependent enzyme [Planctomycetota bacterium]
MARIALEGAAAARACIRGRDLVAFAGCDYLGLAHDSEVEAALRAGVERYGISASASRVTTGNAVAHEELERDLARFLGLEAALLVPDGYLASQILFQGLACRDPAVIVDREAHVSIRDALAASSIQGRDYEFCDARSAAESARATGSDALVVVTDGAYPVMRGIAPLAELLALVPQSGLLVVDDCHGTGVLGARGRGSHEHAGIVDPRLVLLGTLSKALGCFGGFVAGPRALIDEVVTRSRAFVGSTPIPPALALAACAAIAILERDASRIARLRANVERVRAVLHSAGIGTHDLPLPVFAWKARTPEAGERAHAALLERGVLVPHVRYPDGLGSYFRLAVSAAHDDTALARLAAALRPSLEVA